MEEIKLIIEDLTEEVILGVVTCISEAPRDGQQYARKDAGWEVVVGGSGDRNTDGGAPDSVYLPSQSVDGGLI